VVGNGRFTAVTGGTYGFDLNIETNGTLTTSSSDIRLKTNLVPMENNLEKVLQLEPYYFTWINDELQRTDIGLVAQQVEQYFPEVVFTNPVDQHMGINYSRFGAILTGAVQDLYTQVTTTDQDLYSILGVTQGDADITELNLGMVSDSVQDLTTDVEGLKGDVASIQNELALINELINPEATTQSSESTESTESTTSSLIQTPSEILEEITRIYEEFKSFVAALSLSATEEDGLLVSSDLNVLGDTTLSDITITGDLQAGLLKLDTLENSLNHTGPACYTEATESHNTELCGVQAIHIQKNLAGNVDIFDGKIVLEPDGTMSVGTVLAEKVVSSEYALEKESKTIGSETLLAGETSIEIQNELVKGETKIFVTPTSNPGNRSLFVSDTKDGESFTISISESADEDISFDWWIVGVE
jgi:hypothetical protein